MFIIFFPLILHSSFRLITRKLELEKVAKIWLTQAKFDPLTTTIFRLTTLADWTQLYLLLFINLPMWYSSHPEAKHHLIFSIILILQQNIWNFGEIYVVDARSLWFIWLIVFILYQWSQHFTAVVSFVVNFLVAALFAPSESFKFFELKSDTLHGSSLNWNKTSQNEILKQLKYHKISYSGNTTILSVLWLTLVLRQSYHTQLAD